MGVEDLATMLQLSHHDAWMNSNRSRKRSNLLLGIERSNPCNEVLELLRWHQKVSGFIVGTYFEIRSFV